jgi:hypothetical protein
MAVDPQRAERRVGVRRRRREAGQHHRLGRERRNGDAVERQLRAQEGLRGCDCVSERLPLHRPRPVDGEHDALRPAEVLGLEPADGPAVLGQLRRQRDRRRADEGQPHPWVRGRVDVGDLDGRRRRRDSAERGRGHGDADPEPDLLPPPDHRP